MTGLAEPSSGGNAIGHVGEFVRAINSDKILERLWSRLGYATIDSRIGFKADRRRASLSKKASVSPMVFQDDYLALYHLQKLLSIDIRYRLVYVKIPLLFFLSRTFH